MTWEDKIIEDFIDDLAPRVWVVDDPDHLVRNERILNKLETKGFDILVFEDPLEFRFQYESLIREPWDKGGSDPVVIIYDSRAIDEEHLPSDILINCHRKAYGLKNIFPTIDAQLMNELDYGNWDKLEQVSKRFQAKAKAQIYDLALRSIFKVDPLVLDEECLFIAKCIQLHLAKNELPRTLAGYFSKHASDYLHTTGWDLVSLLSCAEYFKEFLHERWTYFIHSQLDRDLPIMEHEGRAEVTFDHSHLKPLMQGLFLSDFILPINLPDTTTPNNWWNVGVKAKPTLEATRERLAQLKEMVISSIPSKESGYRDWMSFSEGYSQLVATTFTSDQESDRDEFWKQVWCHVDEAFTAWFHTKYSGLHNLPPRPPVMVHHINKQLLTWYNETKQKSALIVLDGLSLAGWKHIQPELLKQLGANVTMQESSTLAWVPSLTPVSRQAIFSGLTPRLFEKSFNSTAKDESHWKTFWESNAGLLKKNIKHIRCDGDEADFKILSEALEEEPKALGITLSKPDIIMHHSVFGWRSYFEDLSKWVKDGCLSELINTLISRGYGISITSDHGNLESIGMGKLSEGSIPESKGQRVVVYIEEILRNNAISKVENTQAWDSRLLPEQIYPLFPSGNRAFDTKDKPVVTHGGISLDEILVPWVNLNRL